MCVAGLNVTTAECSHRWYELVKSCSQINNLANCPEKLRLEGWENRHETCPFCTGSAETHLATHRLFGSTSSASSVASSPVDVMGQNRTSRRGSNNTINGVVLGPLSRQSSAASSIELGRAQRSKEMNDRIHLYLCSEPHEVLPSGRRFYPTYPSIVETGVDSNTSSSNNYVRFIDNKRSSFSRGWNRLSSRLLMKPV